MKEEQLDRLLQSLPYLPSSTCAICADVKALGGKYARSDMPAVVRNPYGDGYICRGCACSFTVEDEDRAAMEQAFFERMAMCMMN